MCESKKTCCCGCSGFEVVPTERGCKVDFTTKDDEKRRIPKRIIICCGEAPKESSAGKCCS